MVEDGQIMEKKNGVPTGRMIPAKLQFPRKYRQARADRTDLQSDKYNKLMSDNTALGVAREFYNHFMQEYNRQLKLPMCQRSNVRMLLLYRVKCYQKHVKKVFYQRSLQPWVDK